jgi:hypothetical protein
MVEYFSGIPVSVFFEYNIPKKKLREEKQQNLGRKTPLPLLEANRYLLHVSHKNYQPI